MNKTEAIALLEELGQQMRTVWETSPQGREYCAKYVAAVTALKPSTVVVAIPPTVPLDQNWRDESDPQLRYLKFLTSWVDWNEWPGGAAEIVSAFNTQREKIDEMKVFIRSHVGDGPGTSRFLEKTW